MGLANGHNEQYKHEQKKSHDKDSVSSVASKTKKQQTTVHDYGIIDNLRALKTMGDYVIICVSQLQTPMIYLAWKRLVARNEKYGKVRTSKVLIVDPKSLKAREAYKVTLVGD